MTTVLDGEHIATSPHGKAVLDELSPLPPAAAARHPRGIQGLR